MNPTEYMENLQEVLNSGNVVDLEALCSAVYNLESIAMENPEYADVAGILLKRVEYALKEAKNAKVSTQEEAGI